MTTGHEGPQWIKPCKLTQEQTWECNATLKQPLASVALAATALVRWPHQEWVIPSGCPLAIRMECLVRCPHSRIILGSTQAPCLTYQLTCLQGLMKIPSCATCLLQVVSAGVMRLLHAWHQVWGPLQQRRRHGPGHMYLGRHMLLQGFMVTRPCQRSVQLMTTCAGKSSSCGKRQPRIGNCSKKRGCT